MHLWESQKSQKVALMQEGCFLLKSEGEQRDTCFGGEGGVWLGRSTPERRLGVG